MSYHWVQVGQRKWFHVRRVSIPLHWDYDGFPRLDGEPAAVADAIRTFIRKSITVLPDDFHVVGFGPERDSFAINVFIWSREFSPIEGTGVVPEIPLEFEANDDGTIREPKR